MARDDDRDDGQRRRLSYNSDDRGDDRSRSRDRDRDDDRGRDSGRDRNDDRGRERASSRDDDDRGRDRDRSERDRGDRDEGRSRSTFTYERRSDEDTRARANSRGGDFDKYLNPDIKMFKPRDGVNMLRILPPTWPKPKHYGYDLWLHYRVGADNQTYLCLKHMRDEADAYFARMKSNGRGGPDPIEEEVVSLQRSGDEKLAKEARARQRSGIYLIDRDAEKEGVQFWAMPFTVDRDLVKQSVNKRTQVPLLIDHPDEGYDFSFEKSGVEQRTKYEAISIERDASRLGSSRWLDFAVANPIPDQLIFYSYDHIRDVLNGGGGSHQSRRDRDDERDSERGRGSDRNRDGGRGESGSRDSRNSRNDDDRADSRSRSESRGRSDEPSWQSVHDMTKRELVDLIEDKRLDIQPKEAKDDVDLADWVCDEMKIKKPASRPRDEDPPKDRDRDEPDDRLRRMRENRDRD